MELKKHFSVRKLLIFVYFMAFGIYLAVGFMPVEATAEGSGFSKMVIPGIDLVSDVMAVDLEEGKLNTPDYIIGSYSPGYNNVFLFGHSSTVFTNLNKVSLNDSIYYDGQFYRVKSIEVLPKSEVKMNELIGSTDVETLSIMTCAGEYYDNGDSSHRLIVIAVVDK